MRKKTKQNLIISLREISKKKNMKIRIFLNLHNKKNKNNKLQNNNNNNIKKIKNKNLIKKF